MSKTPNFTQAVWTCVFIKPICLWIYRYIWPLWNVFHFEISNFGDLIFGTMSLISDHCARPNKNNFVGSHQIERISEQLMVGSDKNFCWQIVPWQMIQGEGYFWMWGNNYLTLAQPFITTLVYTHSISFKRKLILYIISFGLCKVRCLKYGCVFLAFFIY